MGSLFAAAQEKRYSGKSGGGQPVPYYGYYCRIPKGQGKNAPGGAYDYMVKMVVIGHSQGGMLAKLTSIDSGDRFWDQSFKVPIDRIDISPETRELLQRSLFYQPVPYVRCVVFISTPHHGSFLVGGRVSGILRRLISLPLRFSAPCRRSPNAIRRPF